MPAPVDPVVLAKVEKLSSQLKFADPSANPEIVSAIEKCVDTITALKVYPYHPSYPGEQIDKIFNALYKEEEEVIKKDADVTTASKKLKEITDKQNQVKDGLKAAFEKYLFSSARLEALGTFRKMIEGETGVTSDTENFKLPAHQTFIPGKDQKYSIYRAALGDIRHSTYTVADGKHKFDPRDAACRKAFIMAVRGSGEKRYTLTLGGGGTMQYQVAAAQNPENNPHLRGFGLESLLANQYGFIDMPCGIGWAGKWSSGIDKKWDAGTVRTHFNKKALIDYCKKHDGRFPPEFEMFAKALESPKATGVIPGLTVDLHAFEKSPEPQPNMKLLKPEEYAEFMRIEGILNETHERLKEFAKALDEDNDPKLEKVKKSLMERLEDIDENPVVSPSTTETPKPSNLTIRPT